MIAERVVPPIDLLLTLNAIPGNHVFLLPNAPIFTIIGATNSFLCTSYTSREQIIGKPLFEVFPDNTADDEGTGVSHLRASLTQVLDRKETHVMANQRYDIINPQTGAFEFKVWAASNSPVLDTEDAIRYIIHTTADITEKVRLQEESAAKEAKLQESENRFRRMVEQAPIAILLSRGEDVVIESINEPMLRFINKTSVEEVLGKKMLEVLPELEGQPALQVVKNVQKTGIPFNGNEQRVDLLIEGQLKRHFFNFSYTPIIEAGIVTGVLHVAIDVSHQVVARKKVEESEERFRTLADVTPNMVWAINADGSTKYVNRYTLDYFGKTAEDFPSNWSALIHPEDLDGVSTTIQQAFANSTGYSVEFRLKRHDGAYRYFVANSAPAMMPDGTLYGYIGTTVDIHEMRETQLKLSESESRFRNLADESPIFIFIIEPDPVAPVSYWNKTWLDYTGQTLEEALGRAWDGILHENDVPVVMEFYVPAFEKREHYFIPSVRVKRHDGEYRWHAFKGNPRYSADGSFKGYVGVGFDVHEQKLAEQALNQSETRTRLAVETAKLGTFEIDVAAQTMIYSARAADIFGLDTTKEWPYTAFSDRIYIYDVPIRNEAHKVALITGDLIYEARITLSNGSIRWIKINGRYFDKEPRTKTLIGTVMDITQEKKAAELLEQKIEERTRELKQVNDQLRQFAYSASHDLQEPLRKITYFIDLLLHNLGSSVSDEDKKIAERIQHTTGRMRVLIDDLLAYSNTTLGIAATEQVALTRLVKDVLDDMEATLIEQDAKIDLQDLPLVKGDPRQLRQLMQNLISNAVKYRSKDKKPHIKISAQAVYGADIKADIPPDIRTKSLYLITVKDNGIGFHPDDAERIFRLFQRLHGKSEYEGTGVGLAIVQKVVENHHGYIWAQGEPGKGAMFYVLFPAS